MGAQRSAHVTTATFKVTFTANAGSVRGRKTEHVTQCMVRVAIKDVQSEVSN